jgi:uncharacterized protein YegP (UPF0339 family)
VTAIDFRQSVLLPLSQGGRIWGTRMAKRVLYKNGSGKWAWRLVSDNGNIIATDGGQGYENKSDCREMADSIIAGDYKDAEKRIIDDDKDKD